MSSESGKTAKASVRVRVATEWMGQRDEMLLVPEDQGAIAEVEALRAELASETTARASADSDLAAALERLAAEEASPTPWKRWLALLVLAILAGAVGALLMGLLDTDTPISWTPPAWEEALDEIKQSLLSVNAQVDGLAAEVAVLPTKLASETVARETADSSLAEVDKNLAEVDTNLAEVDERLAEAIADLVLRVGEHLEEPDLDLADLEDGLAEVSDQAAELAARVRGLQEKLESHLVAKGHGQEPTQEVERSVLSTPPLPYGKRPWKDAVVNIRVRIDRDGVPSDAEIVDAPGREGSKREANQFLAQAVVMGARFKPIAADETTSFSEKVLVRVRLYSEKNPELWIPTADRERGD